MRYLLLIGGEDKTARPSPPARPADQEASSC
jgi:hypothetical protein